MREKVLAVALALLTLGAVSYAADAQRAEAFAGQDLHIQGDKLIIHQLRTDQHVLVLEKGAILSIGGSTYSGDQAVIWLTQTAAPVAGRPQVEYKVRAYLSGDVSSKIARAGKTVPIAGLTLEEDGAVVLSFNVTGQVFVTANTRSTEDPRQLELYRRAEAAPEPGPEFVVQPEAQVPPPPERMAPVEVPREEGFVPELPVPPPVEEQRQPETKELQFQYPVNISPAGASPLEFESTVGPEGTQVLTIIGRFYLWKKLDEEGHLIEMQADSAVVFWSPEKVKEAEQQQLSPEEFLKQGAIPAIYVAGDVILTEGDRTIRAEELYYDFIESKALAVQALFRTFDVGRGMPIYLRAVKLRQVAANRFAAEDVLVTTSEFYKPQLSLQASRVYVTDDVTVDAEAGELSDNSLNIQMEDVRMKVGDTTLLRWPKMQTDLQRPDVAIKRVHVGSNSIWGPSLETDWFLSRLLGLQEPEGTDSTLSLDYYGDRGPGAGAEVEYEGDDYFGNMLGYIIHDHGEDTLGRADFREDLEPPTELRGRFTVQHRQFLPYNWQFTLEGSYLSDLNFLEQYYREEYNAGKEQETLVQMKRLEDNWALSLLGKGQINYWQDVVEQFPSVEYNRVGDSIFGDTFTMFSNSAISRSRQQIGADQIVIDQHYFTFGSHRTELDMPLWMSPFKIVPFAAGSFGHDDRSGFARGLVNGTESGPYGDSDVYIGEAGLRAGTQLWKLYPDVSSRLWDISQLRHVISPGMTAVAFAESDDVVEQRNVFNIGVSQRLQTKRGTPENRRTVDWMRLDTSFTWVNDSDPASMSGADQFIWNRPFVPLRVFSAPAIFNSDLQSSLQRAELFGPRRNFFSSDYVWRMTDTTAVLSDMYYDAQSCVVEQFDIGFSRLVWPELSYYIGSRYLKRVDVLDQEGSNVFTFATTYQLDPRYTLIFAQQFDFDYEATLRSDVTLIRRYNRLYTGLTFSADSSLDTQSVVISIWPQGVPELAVGKRGVIGVGGQEFEGY